ncbi:hypothetical protein ACV35P_31900, partial [Pseudomonas aeruginosa]
MVVVLSLVGGAASARNGTPDNDTATTFSNQICQALPGLLSGLNSRRAGLTPASLRGNSMRRQKRKFWIFAALAILTYGYPLPSLTQGRAGPLGHTME